MRKLFILFFALTCWSSVQADVIYRYSVNGNNSPWYNTGQEACDAYHGSGYTFKPNAVIPSPSSGSIYGQCYSAKGIAGMSILEYYVAACPSGQTHNAAGVCVVAGPVCSTPAGGAVTWNQYEGHASNLNASFPDGVTAGGDGYELPTTSPTCGITGTANPVQCWSVPSASGGKDMYCSYSATSNGVAAPVGTAPSAPDRPADSSSALFGGHADAQGNCPGGTVQAGVDSGGITICIGSGTNPSKSSSTSTTTSPTTTSTATDGTKTETSSTSTTNSDGSVTTTTTTKVTSPDGTVKTSVSSNTGNTPTGGSGKSEDSKDFCTAHPELTVCRNSSVSGSCGQVSCQGDAIQCATLRAAAAMQCAQQQDIDALKASPHKALGDQILSGADPMGGQISDTLKGTDVDMSRVSFDQSGFLGGGTCLASRSFVVLGRVVPVDFTTVCNNIAPLRAVMMAVALIMSYLIVGRSVVGS